MYLTSNTLEEIKKDTAKFVSFKFLDVSGELRQFDVLTKNFTDLDFIISGKSYSLKPFKKILDPFRSTPTFSLFCENIKDIPNFRKKMISQWESFIENEPEQKQIMFNLWQSFFIIPLEVEENNDYMLTTEPADRLSDMRSEIVNSLNEMNVDTILHFHGKSKNESVIGIKDSNIVDLADKIVILRYIIKNIALSYGYEVNFYQQNSVNLKLEMISNDAMMSDKLLKVVKNMDTIIGSCKEIKSIAIGHQEEKDKGEDGTRTLLIDCITEDIYNPYLLLLNLMIHNS